MIDLTVKILLRQIGHHKTTGTKSGFKHKKNNFFLYIKIN